MVDKTRLINKKNLLTLFGVLIIIGFLVFVFAVNLGGEIISPTQGSNNSGLINVTCNTTGIYGALNATVYYNMSGGPITTSAAYMLGNDTNRTRSGNAGQGVENVSQINVTINTASFTDSTVYNLSCTVCNVTIGTGGGLTHCWNVSTITNVSFDNTNPRVTNLTINRAMTNLYFNGSQTLTLNVTVNDSVIVSKEVPTFPSRYVDPMHKVGSVFFNITNSTENEITGNFTKATNLTHRWDGSSNWNATFVISTGLPDGVYNITVWVNETVGEASYTVHENKSESIQITIDNTGPTVTHSCSPSSVALGQIVECVCSGNDATSGVNYTYDGTTTYTDGTSRIVTSITPTSTGTFTRTCSIKDRIGNLTAVAVSYTVTSPSSDTTTSGGPTTSKSTATISAAETPVIMKGFESGSGIKEIEVITTQSVQNAEITVTKYESKPAAVSVAKSGDVYKYIQVKADALKDKLSKATMTIQVEKTWVSDQDIPKEGIALFKYDEIANKWNELTTTFKSEDTTYYYYTADVTSFSYFAIAPKGAVVSEGEAPSEEEEEEQVTAGFLGLPYWAWIIIGLVILGIIIGGGFALKKKKKK